MSKFVCIILLITLVGIRSINAQRASSELDSVLLSGLMLVQSEDEPVDSISIVWLFETDPEFSIEPSMQIQEWHQRHYHSDLGIRLTASANRHFGEGFDNELEDFDRYRVSLGIEWNLYDEGWFKNHSRARIHENEAQILQLKKSDEELQRAYGSQYNAIIYLFNKEKIEFLSTYNELLKESLPVYQQYYLRHLMPYHEVLELKKRIEKFDLIIEDYSSFNAAFENTYGLNWTLRNSKAFGPMAISISDLLQDEGMIEKQIMVRDLENENLYLKNRTKSDVKIGLYARTNFTNGQLGGLNGNYHTIGMRVSVPLRSIYSHSNNLGKLEIEENNQRHDMIYKERKKELMVNYYEYEYNLQRFTQLHYDRLKLKEKIRQQAVRLNLDSTRSSVIREFAVLREYMDVGYEMIGVRQLLYLGLLSMQVKLPEENIADFCEPIQFKKDKKLRGDRIFQITEEDAKRYGADFIVNYLTNNEAFQILSSGLTPTKKELLKAYGFELIDCLPAEVIVIPITNFKDRLEVEQYIDQQSGLQSKIFFDSFSNLIDLEMKTLLNH